MMIGNSQKDLSLFEFQQKFSTDKDCLEYMALTKWGAGFKC